MSKPVTTVTPDRSVEECARIMEEKKIRRIPVVEDKGALYGIVSLADIALQAKNGVAGQVVKEVSEPGKSTSVRAR